MAVFENTMSFLDSILGITVSKPTKVPNLDINFGYHNGKT